jgi:hypothetical protein
MVSGDHATVLPPACAARREVSIAAARSAGRRVPISQYGLPPAPVTSM